MLTGRMARLTNKLMAAIRITKTMSEFTVVNHDTQTTRIEPTKSDAQQRVREAKRDFDFADEDLEIVSGGYEAYDVVEDKSVADGGGVVDAEPVQENAPEPAPAESLSKNPIQFLQNVNTDFVNTIKGKQAVSKQGFRFIQREFEITTESEVVQWLEDPLGCVVWAKAELPSGYSAEAHGEGYQFEGDVSDNEFVRYADTRAKNRALSDLTSAGALAVSELQD
jgi:hypothetical protein